MTTILAYIDPGFGQLIWLSIVSAFVGFVFYLRKFRAWVVGIFLKIFRHTPKVHEATAEKTDVESGTQ